MLVNKLKALRDGGEEEGFTLIELMIVVVIIGILAAIAIPIFANQQKSAISAGLKSDVKNTNTALATALVKKPTATGITSAQTGGAGNDVVVTVSPAVVGPPAVAAITFTVKVSDSATTLTVTGAWNDYTITGANTAADPATVTYSSLTGKLS